MTKSKKSVKAPVVDGREKEQEQAAGNVSKSMNQEDLEQNDQDQKNEQADDQQVETDEPEPEKSAEDFKDLYLRTLAEFDNFKKRAMREMIEFKKFANETLIKELLPVADNLERAIESAGAQGENQAKILEGVKLTQKEILKVLEKFGVTPICAVGQAFDPAYHQAVMAEESGEHPEETVCREMQKGYLLKERLLRPAMVAVSKGKQDT